MKISRCENIEDFLSLFVQLERFLNSQMYSSKYNPQLISSQFRLKQCSAIPNPDLRSTLSSYLMRRILCHAVLSNSPCDGFRSPDLSKEFVQTILHRQLESTTSTCLKPGALDINCKILLAKCLTSKYVSKLDKTVGIFTCLKYFRVEKICGLLQIYYRQRKTMRHSRRSHALDDLRKNSVDSNMQRVETSPQHLVCLFDFADRLSKIILQELHNPSGTSAKPTSSSHPPGSQLDNRHMNPSDGCSDLYNASAAIEETAACLERSIMREALSSIRRHRHLHNQRHHHHIHQYHAPSTRTSQALVRFADNLTSQILGEASQSAQKRMNSVYTITDSILRLISRVRPLDLKSVSTIFPQQKSENETQAHAAESDREARLGTFAGSLTSQCLSEVLQDFNGTQPP
ncbi:hypothetical protein Aperf_G00000022071 [Anoplocephala perfoliata]